MLCVDLKISPPIIAHRGASAYAPENTIAAFLKAYELGVRWVEFDIMLTADNQAVVIHDETLDRTTNGTGLISECTYDQIKTLDAGIKFGPKFANQKIPLLEEVILKLNRIQKERQ
jgi:glycerophosphoryl diester phosphodiesterase